MRVYIDIETSPPIGTFPNPDKVVPPKNYKKREAIEAYQEERAYPLWAGQATEIALAQTIIIGACIDDGEVWQGISMNERDLCQQFTAWLDQHAPVPENPKEPGPVYVAFNGLRFDFRILAARGVKYRLDSLTQRMRLLNKWGDATHVDPFQALGGEGSQEDWESHFGFERSGHLKGSQVFEVVGKQPMLALQKNKDDLLNLRRLDQALREGGLY